jgi:post-segregation antitoxin (ccd killing protein)
MDITVYLPDELGRRAKDASLPLSRMLRRAVEDELRERDAMSELLTEPRTYVVDLIDEKGSGYTGRITGRLIALWQTIHVYVTEDGRVLGYDEEARRHWTINDPETDLRDRVPAEVYVQAMKSLCIAPIVDL